MVELTSNSFDEFVKEGVVLVDFWADWCMPCLMMAPVVDKIGEKFEGKAKVGKVNIEENQELAQKFNVNTIPNFIVFKDGKEVENFVGGMTAEELNGKLGMYLG